MSPAVGARSLTAAPSVAAMGISSPSLAASRTAVALPAQLTEQASEWGRALISLSPNAA